MVIDRFIRRQRYEFSPELRRVCSSALRDIIELRREIRSKESLYEDAKKADDYERARQIYEQLQKDLDELEEKFKMIGVSSPICHVPREVEEEFYDAINLLYKYRPAKFKR